MSARDRGAALLTVLLLVALMAVMAATMLDRLNLATRMAANGQAMGQARLYILSAENIVASRLGALVSADRSRTVDRIGALDRETAIPLSRGSVSVRVSDAGNCFNINSLVTGEAGQYRLRLPALLQMRRLMDALAIDPGTAATISDAAADWIDNDDTPLPNGAEDDFYLAQAQPYRTSGRLMVDPTEMRGLRGMTEPVYRRLRPWMCALPTTQDAPVNLNTLRVDQVPLLAAMPAVSPDGGRLVALIGARPETGWASVGQALGPLATDGGIFGPGQVRQLSVTSRWFEARMVARVDRVDLEEWVLIDAALEPARVVNRSWGETD